MNVKYKPIEIGQIINDMCVIGDFRDEKNNRRMLKCRCNKCGRVRDISESDFRKNPGSTIHVSVCGRSIKIKDDKFKAVWSQMKGRIYNENNSSYGLYGAKNISTDYDAYADFFDDMYLKYQEAKQTYPNQKISIDRIDYNKGYVRGNLIWVPFATLVRRQNNGMKFLALSPEGKLYLSNNQTMFAQRHGFDARYISACLHYAQNSAMGWKFTSVNPVFEYQYDNDSSIIKEFYY